MTLSDFDDFEDRADLERVLSRYQVLQAAVAAQSPEAGAWISRVASIEGVADERLPSLHGRLIALGHLKFQVGGPQTGVQYQVSSQGKRALLGCHGDHEESAADEADAA